MKKEFIETVDNEKMEVSVMAIKRSVDQKKLIITQANALARSVQEMTLQEKRLLLLAISHIRQSDDNFVLYRIPVARIIEYLDLDDGSYYSRINKITTNLLGRVIEIEKENGDWKKFQWVSYCCYYSKGTSDMPEACLDIRMHDCLRPLLLNLQKHFGSVYLHQIAPIPGFNSMRVFEILYYSAMYSKKERKFKKSKISFEVVDFKKRLGLEGKYKDFRDFRKDILNRAQKDCEVCSPLIFTWTEEKKGKKIITLHLTINVNPRYGTLLKDDVIDAEFKSLPEPTTQTKNAPEPSAQKGGLKSIGEIIAGIPQTEVDSDDELIFDYALKTFSAEEKRQASVTIGSIPAQDRQTVLDEFNSAIGQNKAREPWPYLHGLVAKYHRGEFTPTANLATQRVRRGQKDEIEQQKQEQEKIKDLHLAFDKERRAEAQKLINSWNKKRLSKELDDFFESEPHCKKLYNREKAPGTIVFNIHVGKRYFPRKENCFVEWASINGYELQEDNSTETGYKFSSEKI